MLQIISAVFFKWPFIDVRCTHPKFLGGKSTYPFAFLLIEVSANLEETLRRIDVLSKSKNLSIKV